VRQDGARAARRQRVPIHLPLGAGELFTGIIDLVRQVEIVYDDDSLGKKYVEGPVRRR